MIVSDINYREGDGEQEVSALVSPATSRGGSFRIWFRAPENQEPLTVSGDPFLAGLLIPCMYAGEDLEIEGPVSETLLRNVPAIQSLITTWYPDFRRITVGCGETYPELPEDGRGFGRGCCFSGGVDSWYSLLKHEDTVTHLVMARGFDVKPEADGDYWDLARRNVERIAREMGRRLLVITTNLRAQTDFQLLYNGRWGNHYTRWGTPYRPSFYAECHFGSCLAAIGLLLRGSLSDLLVPSSFSYRELLPQGSHPLLDPLFSTRDLNVIHDGCEAGRLEKIVNHVSQSGLALETLRVCWQTGGEFNCGRCGKCVRTMMQLRAAGCMGRATSFPPLNLEEVKLRTRAVESHKKAWFRQIESRAVESGDQPLRDACRVITGRKFSFAWFSHTWKSRVAHRLGRGKRDGSGRP